MQNDTLQRLLVIAILGERQIVQAHSKLIADTLYRVGEISIEKLGQAAPLDALERSCKNHFEKGNRLILLTGFPSTGPEAADLIKLCPNLMAFSIEPLGATYERTDPRRVLSRTKLIPVDASKSGGTRHRYMCNHIDQLITGARVHASITTTKRPLLQAVA